MKRTLITYCILVLAVCFQHANAQGDQQEMMKAWQAYMTPGEVHKILSTADGNWTFEASTWMAPGAPPEKSTGTATNKMIMGGRYQQSNYSGNMMGMPFEGQSIMGYDNARKVMQSTWIDNMGTGIMHLEGTVDHATRSINFAGTMTDPMTGKEVQVKEKFTWIDNNTQKMEMYDLRDGKETKTMEITFKRKA